MSRQIALARVQYQEAAGDEFNINTAIHLACVMVQNAGRLWHEMKDIDRRQRLQRAQFPEGLNYHPEKGFGTAANTYPVKVLREFGADEMRLERPMNRRLNPVLEMFRVVTEIFLSMSPAT